MKVQKISYKDMAEVFMEHNKKNGKNQVVEGVIVFHPACFKALYKDQKYRSYKVSSNNNAWIDGANNDEVVAFCVADNDNIIKFNNIPQFKVEYCYILSE